MTLKAILHANTQTTLRYDRRDEKPKKKGGGDYHIQTSSPAVDAGSVTTVDCDCGNRPAGSGWDIGYDEVGSTATSFSVYWNEQP